GNFTTFLGFEWTASDNENCHINFYYKDVYPDAKEYSSSNVFDLTDSKPNFDDIFQAMSDEWDKGHLNIGFPHHPLFVDVDWTHLSNNVNHTNRNKILRGVEVYSAFGTAVGERFTPDLPYYWPYYHPAHALEKDNSWVENAFWEWSENDKKYQRFALMAGSDIHKNNRPGSAQQVKVIKFAPYYPAGIIATYAVHNNRSEIWDAINDCDMYGTQLLKIRANARFDGQMALGRWINCSSPLNITITAMSTFPGLDISGKSMCPHSYSPDELDYPIQDIWLIKKDRDKGKPWCKVINHSTPNDNIGVANFQDFDVQPNDFYWIAIRQKGELLKTNLTSKIIKLLPDFIKKRLGIEDTYSYMAFIGPVFIDNVTN
ncbi:MAG: hypothetical protein KAW45_05675, partial [Thermoplasmatales archaeon]|nr:hypothetical protein [Thermoplasmatales archaeon]